MHITLNGAHIMSSINEQNFSEKLEDEFWKQRFALKRSYFYHERRVVFWSTMLFLSNGMEMLLNSTAAAFLFNKNQNSFAQWAVLVSAVISFAVMWFNADKRIQSNNEKRARFLELENMIPDQPEEHSFELLEKLKQERFKIEQHDDAALPCVDALARNDACRALGIPEDRKLNILERTVGRILPIPYDKKRI